MKAFVGVLIFASLIYLSIEADSPICAKMDSSNGAEVGAAMVGCVRACMGKVKNTNFFLLMVSCLRFNFGSSYPIASFSFIT